MDITWTTDDVGRKTVTAVVEPHEDTLGDISGLLWRGRLEAFLSVYGDPQLDRALERTDPRELLVCFGSVANMCTSRLDDLMVRARDQYDLGWGAIANAVEMPRQTVRSRILRRRREMAEGFNGVAWYIDAEGVHETTPEDALSRYARPAESAIGDPETPHEDGVAARNEWHLSDSDVEWIGPRCSRCGEITTMVEMLDNDRLCTSCAEGA